MTKGIKLAIVLSILIVPITLFASSGGASDIEVSHLHWNPENPEEGDNVTFFVLVGNISSDESISVHLVVEDANLTMVPWEGELNATEEIIFTSDHKFSGPGIHNVTVIIISGSETVSIQLGTVDVEEDNGEKDDTIFGMPRWWCSISILIATGGFIFITWAYFKGRKLQIQNEQETGISGSRCSECGKVVQDDSEECRHCGADLSDVEYVCGKCGKVVSSSARKCPHCGTSLHKIASVENEISRSAKGKKKTDPDLVKLKGSVDMKGKTECRECGCIYLSKEKSCPECGSSRKRKS